MADRLLTCAVRNGGPNEWIEGKSQTKYASVGQTRLDEIHQPEIEALIQQRLQSGVFHDVEEVLLHALRTSELPASASARGSEAKNLVELFASSPFAGMSMDFERDKDSGREMDL